MKRNILNSLLVLVIMTTVMACKTKKNIVKAPSAAPEAVADNKRAENFKLLRAKDVPFNTLSLKGKVNLDLDGKSNNVNVTVRIKKDTQIWMSITAIAGIEVARALITPDSIIVRNNLQGLAIKKPFSYIHTFTSKQINFKMLQAILTGNTIPELMNESSTLDLNAGVFTLSGEKESLMYRALFNTLLKTGELNLNDPKAGRALKVVYADYQQVTDALFPAVMQLNSLSGNKKTNISFDFSKIERNVQLDFPFSVPKRFEIIN